MRYEQEMLKRASESIAMNHRLKSEYGKVFVEVKDKNYVKFPSISTKKTGTGSRSSNVSNPSRSLSIY